MSTYKMIALDMDGTLLSSSKHILPETKAAIWKAAQAGKMIAIASGRAVSEIEDCREELGEIRYVVCTSGAVVYDRLEQKMIYREGFTEELKRKLLQIAVTEDVMTYCISSGEVIAEREKLMHLEDYNMSVYTEMVNRIYVKVDHIWETCVDGNLSLEKINFFSKTAKMRERIYKKLENLPVTIAFAEGNSLEISPKGITKATGLQKLGQYLSLSAEEIIAVGDADNDREMLKYAGLSVAMGNASTAIKDICDVVVSDNDHNGCAEAIREYLLKKGE